MNLRKSTGSAYNVFFSTIRFLVRFVPVNRVSAFGNGDEKISSILVINLDRQPKRWEQIRREFRRFQTFCGAPLESIVQRHVAIDARDGRASAATADVDSNYRIGDQLYVQPDARLEECFGFDEPIKMSRQEIAIARSHIEVWKTIATGSNKFVLVLEDDVWFRLGAAKTIERAWSAATRRCREQGGPHLLYFSYSDAGGTVERTDICDVIFRPVRGLWFLSGYVLSREGAMKLLKAMPVVGPVDTWMNYRFGEMGALALSSPAILQRQDCVSGNSYSILPYLARAGVVDSISNHNSPNQASVGSVLVWTAEKNKEGLSMALSMLGLRVRACDEGEEPIDAKRLSEILETFDVLLNAQLQTCALSAAINTNKAKFIFEAEPKPGAKFTSDRLPRARTIVLTGANAKDLSWQPLCSFLGLEEPVDIFPVGAPRDFRLFRDDRKRLPDAALDHQLQKTATLDDSPWVLPSDCNWQPRCLQGQYVGQPKKTTMQSSMTTQDTWLRAMVETFPGSLTSFERSSLIHNDEGTNLVFSKSDKGHKPYCSGAFASVNKIIHGRIEVEIKAASGSGLITGFFLHRSNPRQEIDVELSGNNPRRMLVNVYFNPGDEDASISFGYRGSPCWIDLGFDATKDYHLYSIDWQPDRIAWLVDGRIVHERRSWDPTPIPHLPMRLHGNLWAPRAKGLAGQVKEENLPAKAIFRNLSVWPESQ